MDEPRYIYPDYGDTIARGHERWLADIRAGRVRAAARRAEIERERLERQRYMTDLELALCQQADDHHG